MTLKVQVKANSSNPILCLDNKSPPKDSLVMKGDWIMRALYSSGDESTVKFYSCRVGNPLSHIPVRLCYIVRRSIKLQLRTAHIFYFLCLLYDVLKKKTQCLSHNQQLCWTMRDFPVSAGAHLVLCQKCYFICLFQDQGQQCSTDDFTSVLTFIT